MLTKKGFAKFERYMDGRKRGYGQYYASGRSHVQRDPSTGRARSTKGQCRINAHPERESDKDIYSKRLQVIQPLYAILVYYF